MSVTFVDFLVVGGVDDSGLFELLLVVFVAASKRRHQLLLSVVRIAAALDPHERALHREQNTKRTSEVVPMRGRGSDAEQRLRSAELAVSV